MELTQQRLKEFLFYDPEEGQWYWRKSGAIAGTISVHGYRIITLGGYKLRSGRLAWLYMTGSWPVEEIDHENRDKIDDRWDNLRELDRSGNAFNKDLQANNTSGVRGVHWDTARQKWNAQIKKDNASEFLGRFDNIDEAIAVRDAAELRVFGPLAKRNPLNMENHLDS